MRVYYIWCSAATQHANELIAVTVTGVGETTVNLRTDYGATLLRYGGTIYDENGEEVSLETVRNNFLATDTASLMARIAQLEALITGGAANV